MDQLTVAENLTLGMEDTSFGFLRKTDKVSSMVSVMNSIEPSITPQQLVSTLSVAQKQIVEIAKAVAAESDILIMDEPTAAISEGEIKRLFTIIRRLRDQNVTVIYISHRLDEIFELGDAVTVMRDGRHIATKPMSEVKDRAELIRMMIGKTVFEVPAARGPPARRGAPGQGALEPQAARDILRRAPGRDRRLLRAGGGGQDGVGPRSLRRRPVSRRGGLPGGEAAHTAGRGHRGRDRAGARGAPLAGTVHHPHHPGQRPGDEHEAISRRGFIRAAEERRVTLEAVDRLRIATNSTEKEVASSLAATSRRWSSPSASLPTPASFCWTSPPAASTWGRRARSTPS